MTAVMDVKGKEVRKGLQHTGDHHVQSVATLLKAANVRLGTGLKSTAAGSDTWGAQSSSASS